MQETNRTTEQEVKRQEKELEDRKKLSPRAWRKRQIEEKISKEDGND
jgi:hypothetical protein